MKKKINCSIEELIKIASCEFLKIYSKKGTTTTKRDSFLYGLKIIAFCFQCFAIFLI